MASNEIMVDENKTKPFCISREKNYAIHESQKPSLHCTAIQQQLNVIFTMITTSEGCTGFLD